MKTPINLTDSSKLRALAGWFDKRDDERGFMGSREVQADLRRIADQVELQEIMGVW